ncbi:hypothetical protein BOX15_Mlig002594g2 [Macrostomum lignano]|uniref:Uncharacterized protein n=2 Tax=Macrostomum lignano TaxID=282301 RepID=A0A267DDA5_9PLAT|nr:hypothetical protein BOX15_Mlig002594g2 [Macrostomum lignano]
MPEGRATKPVLEVFRAFLAAVANGVGSRVDNAAIGPKKTAMSSTESSQEQCILPIQQLLPILLAVKRAVDSGGASMGQRRVADHPTNRCRCTAERDGGHSGVGSDVSSSSLGSCFRCLVADDSAVCWDPLKCDGCSSAKEVQEQAIWAGAKKSVQECPVVRTDEHAARCTVGFEPVNS